MMSAVHSFSMFFFIALIVCLAPGPAMLYTAQQALAHGRRGVWLAALGVELGTLILVLLAVFGLSLILEDSKQLFIIIQILGALYLAYLGIRAIHSYYRSSTSSQQSVKLAATSIFTRGLLLNLLNPKVILFLAAFLPQFVTPGVPHAITWLLALGLIFNAMGLLVNVIVGQLVAITHRNAMSKASSSPLLRWVSSWGIGVIFIGLGMVMLLRY